MAEKKKRLSLHKLLNIVMTIPVVFSLIGNVSSMVADEAKQSKNSLGLLAVLVFIAAILIASAWFCILTILYFYFDSLHFSWLGNLLIILAINLFLLLLIVISILRTEKKIFFPNTLKFIRYLFGSYT